MISIALVPRSMIAAQSARAPLQMKAQGEAVQVLECLDRQPPHRMLGNARKQPVPQLGDGHHEKPPYTIGDDHRERHGDQCGGGDRGRTGTVEGEGIDGGFVGEREGDGDDLGRHQTEHGGCHAEAQVEAPFGPEIREQPAIGIEVADTVLRVAEVLPALVSDRSHKGSGRAVPIHSPAHHVLQHGRRSSRYVILMSGPGS